VRIPYAFASEISHYVHRKLNGGSVGGKTAAKTRKQHTKVCT
jgi:hypothetical protein